MTIDKIKERIEECCSHFTFEYNDKICGIDPIYIPEDKSQKYEMWCGDNEHTETDIDKVISLPLFDGKSLKEICDKIDIISW